MTDAQEVYQDLMVQVLKLRKQLRDQRVQKVLAKLANTKNKGAYVRHLQADLEQQLQKSHRNNEEIDNLLELLEDLV